MKTKVKANCTQITIGGGKTVYMNSSYIDTPTASIALARNSSISIKDTNGASYSFANENGWITERGLILGDSLATNHIVIIGECVYMLTPIGDIDY